MYGDWLPRQIGGRFTAFCAILRMLYLATMLFLWHRSQADVVFVDGVSAPVALLRLFGFYTIFYCHFPDQLLVQPESDLRGDSSSDNTSSSSSTGNSRRHGQSLVLRSKRLYRVVLDALEESTTGCANEILVNSKFTADVYRQTFRRLAEQQQPPQVLYPVVQQLEVEQLPVDPLRDAPYCAGYTAVFVSLNRYERKKRVELAIEALLHFQQLKAAAADSSLMPAAAVAKVLLVVAGGYDRRVAENVEYFDELTALCRRLGIRHYTTTTITATSNDNTSTTTTTSPSNDNTTSTSTSTTTGAAAAGVEVEVVFRVSISSRERTALMLLAAGLLYTPDREHFGIVPLEVGIPSQSTAQRASVHRICLLIAGELVIHSIHRRCTWARRSSR